MTDSSNRLRRVLGANGEEAPADIDLTTAVNLDAIDCRGCRWKATAADVCKRYPPVFLPSTPTRAPNGEIALAQGGWTFPPAVQRCGEWTKTDA